MCHHTNVGIWNVLSHNWLLWILITYLSFVKYHLLQLSFGNYYHPYLFWKIGFMQEGNTIALCVVHPLYHSPAVCVSSYVMLRTCGAYLLHPTGAANLKAASCSARGRELGGHARARCTCLTHLLVAASAPQRCNCRLDLPRGIATLHAAY